MVIAMRFLVFLFAIFQIALLILAAYVVFQIAQDPASIGHFAGAVVRGFKEAF